MSRIKISGSSFCCCRICCLICIATWLNAMDSPEEDGSLSCRYEESASDLLLDTYPDMEEYELDLEDEAELSSYLIEPDGSSNCF